MTNSQVEMSEKLKAMYPGFKVGYHSVQVKNNTVSETVARSIAGLAASIKPHGQELLEATKSMATFYKTLGATREYHISSLITATLNGRKYKSINPAVDLVYILELQHGVLMGLHDLDRLSGPIGVDITNGSETIDHISKRKITVDRRDIVFRNNNRIISSLTGGPDDATKVTADTLNIVVLAFGSPADSVELIERALSDCQQKFVEWMQGEVGPSAIVTA